MPEILPDILLVVFQQLAGDYETLLNISLTCRAWRSLALPALFQVVDISSHNNGHQPEHEGEVMPIVYADYHGDFRQPNLVPRQHAFLRLMTRKPQLARLVKSLTWTLVWVEINELELKEEIMRQTWDVFSRMVNVWRLDLASLHELGDDSYVRQNPAILFPKTKSLRLLGWMHRGLVRSILASIDPCKLRSLELDYLEDEGALPNGYPMSSEFAGDNAHCAKKGASLHPPDPDPDVTSSSNVYHQDLILRQETGQAYIFPGPMWLPLHLLSPSSLDSLTHLQIKVGPFHMNTDLRGYHTMFQKTAAFIVKVKETLESLVVVFAETKFLYSAPKSGGCGTGHSNRLRYRIECYRPWYIKMAKLFLEPQLAALNENAFPRLQHIHFEGFHILQDANPEDAKKAGLANIFQSIQECRFTDATFIDIPSVQGRRTFCGYMDGEYPDEGRFPGLLASS